ncbi:MAG: GNAT family N-acetyltransferase [Patescibacteria group bacterium]
MSVDESANAKECTRVHIRWLIRRDMPEVLAIEQASFQEPWTEEEFLYYMRQRNTIGMVADLSEKVVALFTYELHEKHICLINLAVHPNYRNQGIGRQCMARLQSKISPERRTKIVALVPKSHEKLRSFFEKQEIEFRLTERKGTVTYESVLMAMAKKDVEEAQVIEDDFMKNYGKEPRDIGAMISNGTRYGIVARNKENGELLGYALYARELGGIDLNGEYGIIVKPKCRRKGIGRKLMMALVEQELPITVSDIYLFCKDQVDFLKAMGVPVPKPEKCVTVKWERNLTSSS